jgi:hypothetical protein
MVKNIAKVLFNLSPCSLHEHDPKWSRPWKITIKPQHAGIRILNLDGYVEVSQSLNIY